MQMQILNQAVTPELREWIRRAGAGRLCRRRHPQGHAGQRLGRCRGPRRADADAAAGAARPRRCRSRRPCPRAPRSPVPEPDLRGAPSVLRLPDREVQVLLTMQRPRVVLFGGFMSDEECDALMDLARPRLARSETVDHHSGGSEVNAARTSDGMFFERGEAPLIQRIEQRIAALLHWPVEQGEGLQILRYRPGAQYRPHFDYFDPAQPGTAAVLKRGGQRVGTLVMYLHVPAQRRRHHLPRRRSGGGAGEGPRAVLQLRPAARIHRHAARRLAGDRRREVGRHQVDARGRVRLNGGCVLSARAAVNAGPGETRAGPSAAAATVGAARRALLALPKAAPSQELRTRVRRARAHRPAAAARETRSRAGHPAAGHRRRSAAATRRRVSMHRCARRTGRGRRLRCGCSSRAGNGYSTVMPCAASTYSAVRSTARRPAVAHLDRTNGRHRANLGALPLVDRSRAAPDAGISVACTCKVLLCAGCPAPPRRCAAGSGCGPARCSCACRRSGKAGSPMASEGVASGPSALPLAGGGSIQSAALRDLQAQVVLLVRLRPRRRRCPRGGARRHRWPAARRASRCRRDRRCRATRSCSATRGRFGRSWPRPAAADACRSRADARCWLSAAPATRVVAVAADHAQACPGGRSPAPAGRAGCPARCRRRGHRAGRHRRAGRPGAAAAATAAMPARRRRRSTGASSPVPVTSGVGVLRFGPHSGRRRTAPVAGSSPPGPTPALRPACR